MFGDKKSIFILITFAPFILGGCGPFISCGGCGPGESTTIGGTVTGLANGNSLTLSMWDGSTSSNTTVSANGPYSFPPISLMSPTIYVVTMASPPSGQSCAIASGNGEALPGQAVNTVTVDCSGNSFNITVTVNGLTEYGLTMQNNGGDDLTFTPYNTSRNFNNTLANGSSYAVTVTSQPTNLVTGTSQTCTLAPGTGTGFISGANVNLTIDCI